MFYRWRTGLQNWKWALKMLIPLVTARIHLIRQAIMFQFRDPYNLFTIKGSWNFPCLYMTSVPHVLYPNVLLHYIGNLWHMSCFFSAIILTISQVLSLQGTYYFKYVFLHNILYAVELFLMVLVVASCTAWVLMSHLWLWTDLNQLPFIFNPIEILL